MIYVLVVLCIAAIAILVIEYLYDADDEVKDEDYGC